MKQCISLADSMTFIEILIAPLVLLRWWFRLRFHCLYRFQAAQGEEEKKSVLKISSNELNRYFFFEFLTRKDTSDWVLGVLYLFFSRFILFWQATKLGEMKKKYTWIKNYFEGVLSDQVAFFFKLMHFFKTLCQGVGKAYLAGNE